MRTWQTAGKASAVMVAISMAAAMGGCGDEMGGDAYYGAPLPSGAIQPSEHHAGETYEEVAENEFVEVAEEPMSTFSIDVDNASYTLMRRDINGGSLPHPDGVRVEEYVNFFDYAYLEPQEHPFSLNLEAAPSAFGEGKHLVRIGLKGRDVVVEEMKPTNLVFLIDVSGSMSSDEKLPLVKRSLYTLLDTLRPSDRVGIVVYAGADGVVMPSTEVRYKDRMKALIEEMEPAGGTNAEAGIVTAYEMAERFRFEGGNNRVIILTDGDFNVGKTGQELIDLIASYREKHISLTAMGYGLGNYNDHQMESLAQEGNGNYFYVDSLQEAERVFGEQLPSTLEVIAADVKIQVEFDPAAVARYRLVGYDNRVLNNEDFRDDSKDAGEIGPGHTVTAFYEVELVEGADETDRLAEVRLRYKDQYGAKSAEFSRQLKVANLAEDFAAASKDFRFGAAVAEYAEILRNSKHSEGARFGDVLEILQATDAGQLDRAELIGLVEEASRLYSAR